MTCNKYVARGQHCGQLSVETNLISFVFNYLVSKQAVLCGIVTVMHLPLD